ncbi:MAG: methylglyoxal synthase, partial [Aggregatilineales bacterium]
MTEERKTVALIAHDGKKADMVAFAIANKETLSHYELIATGTTGGLISDKAGLTIERVLSGPKGGDAQIAARIVGGDIEAVFFFID